jgi:hypothetical protein
VAVPLVDIHTEEQRWHSANMPASVSRGVYHHGKRHKFVVTAKDDSPEAFKAALRELDEKVRSFTEATTPKVERRSYRKNKALNHG